MHSANIPCPTHYYARKLSFNLLFCLAADTEDCLLHKHTYPPSRMPRARILRLPCISLAHFSRHVHACMRTLCETDISIMAVPADNRSHKHANAIQSGRGFVVMALLNIPIIAWSAKGSLRIRGRSVPSIISATPDIFDSISRHSPVAFYEFISRLRWYEHSSGHVAKGADSISRA